MTLEETREKLAAYKSSGDDNTAKFEEVMRMLENIMPATRAPTEKRATSAPESKTPDRLGNLPIISEETDQRSGGDDTLNWQRAVTAPIQKDWRPEDKTIRVVPPSSPGTVAPLNVRKRSNGSETSYESQRHLSVKTSNEFLSQRRPVELFGGLEVIDEDTTVSATPTIVRKKRSGWFGLSKKPVELDHSSNGREVSSPLQDSDSRKERKSSRVISKPPPPTLRTLPEEPPASAQSSEFPIRKRRVDGGRHVLSRLWGRIGGEKEDVDQTGRCILRFVIRILCANSSDRWHDYDEQLA
jgi:hypothetical protein